MNCSLCLIKTTSTLRRPTRLLASDCSRFPSPITMNYQFLLPFFSLLAAVLATPNDVTELYQDDDEIVERALLLPGTNYCGLGNKKVPGLGLFSNTDACCKVHDNCPTYIKPFGRQYQLFNFSPLPLKHCDCNDKFYNCLKDLNNIVSNTVGKTFFNILKRKCFRTKTVYTCIKKNFWGKCKKYGYQTVGTKYFPKRY